MANETKTKTKTKTKTNEETKIINETKKTRKQKIIRLQPQKTSRYLTAWINTARFEIKDTFVLLLLNKKFKIVLPKSALLTISKEVSIDENGEVIKRAKEDLKYKLSLKGNGEYSIHETNDVLFGADIIDYLYNENK